MPWKECNAMDERLRFVAKLLDGEKKRKNGVRVKGQSKNGVGVESWRQYTCSLNHFLPNARPVLAR